MIPLIFRPCSQRTPFSTMFSFESKPRYNMAQTAGESDMRSAGLIEHGSEQHIQQEGKRSWLSDSAAAFRQLSLSRLPPSGGQPAPPAQPCDFSALALADACERLRDGYDIVFSSGLTQHISGILHKDLQMHATGLREAAVRSEAWCADPANVTVRDLACHELSVHKGTKGIQKDSENVCQHILWLCRTLLFVSRFLGCLCGGEDGLLSCGCDRSRSGSGTSTSSHAAGQQSEGGLQLPPTDAPSAAPVATCSPSAAARTAYSEVLQPYHGWMLAQVAKLALLATPNKHHLLEQLQTDEASATIEMRQLVGAMRPVAEEIKHFLESHNLWFKDKATSY